MVLLRAIILLVWPRTLACAIRSNIMHYLFLRLSWYHIYVYTYLIILITFHVLMHSCAYILCKYKVQQSCSLLRLNLDFYSWFDWWFLILQGKNHKDTLFLSFFILKTLYVVYGLRPNHSFVVLEWLVKTYLWICLLFKLVLLNASQSKSISII